MTTPPPGFDPQNPYPQGQQPYPPQGQPYAPQGQPYPQGGQYPPPQYPPPQYPAAPPPKKKPIWLWVIGGVVGLTALGSLLPDSKTKDTTSATTTVPSVSVPSPENSRAEAAPAPPEKSKDVTSTAAIPVDVTIPEVAGQNAEIVRKKLEKLGLTDVSLASVNPEFSVVVMASNWTVVSIEPAPGTVVKSDDPVVVKVTK